ncbi:MAG: sensor histidine kinase [Desulfobulbus sp.]|jgi:two-component system NtrC family sensor kinase
MRVWDMSHLRDDTNLPERRDVDIGHVYNHEDNQKNINQIRKHFKQLETRLLLGLLLGFLLPNALLSFYFQYQFAYTLKTNTQLNLTAIAESRKNTIDFYLQERVVDLYGLFRDKNFVLKPSQDDMHGYLQTLRTAYDGFVDVGFFDTRGVQIGYAGPYPELKGRNYSQEAWYKQLMHSTENYTISDNYQGFRNRPHFTIAVKQRFAGKLHVMRATLDPDKLYMYIRAINQGEEMTTILINRQGDLQVMDPGGGPQQRSAYIPGPDVPMGVVEAKMNGEHLLIAHAWLKGAPWALLTAQPMAVAQKGVLKTRAILTAGLIVISLLISTIIFLTIKKVVRRARHMAEKGQQLQEMLAHASKMASIGELAAGVAHEINNPLAIIMATSGVIRDMLNPEFELDHSPEAIYAELDVIDNAATRAKGITRKLQDMGKTRVPCEKECDLHALIDEVLARLKKVELKSKRIEIVNELTHLPPIFAEAGQLSQVFTNLLINAADAIVDKGTITLTSGVKDNMAWITIADTGKGIPPENLQRIFHPFFTTKGGGKGTGLGLSIAASIVKYMGGTIQVTSIVGSGSAFTVLLPL